MDSEKYTLWLVGGAALLIDNMLTLQQRQDILDCVLYAQLRANKLSAERGSEHVHWFESYRQNLDELGWVRLLNHYEQRTLEVDTPSPLQCMQQWLAMRDNTLVDALEGLAPALAAASAKKHLAQFVQPQGGVVNELGVVSSAQVLALCSLRVEALPVAQPDTAQARRMELRAWVGSLDEEAFKLKRFELRTLIESKQEPHYYTYVGKLVSGGVHGQV